MTDVAPPMVVQVGRLHVSTDARGTAEARRGFAAQRGVRLPAFLHPALVDHVTEALAGAVLVPRVHRRVHPPVTDLVLRDRGLLGRLHVIANDARVFEAVRTVTGCGSIGCFMGSVYRMMPGAGHDDVWHDDVDGVRMLAMSVNLGAPYRGGVLQLRERRSGRILFEAANTVPGDAILFEVSEDLEHRVTRVEGDTPKTALAGWFRREPSMTAWLKRSAAIPSSS